jgi:hypothetical protein
MPQYADFVKTTGIGLPGGLLGVHCRHFFSGASESIPPRYTPEELTAMEAKAAQKKPHTWIDGHGNQQTREFNLTEANDRMRELERGLRNNRALAAGYRSGGNEMAYKQEMIKYKKGMGEYKAFAKAMGIPAQVERIVVDGLSKIIS